MNDSSSLTYSGSGTVDQSICPAGWMLPRWTNSGSYGYLKNQLSLSISNLKNSPVYFVYSDSWYGNSSSSIIGYNLRYMPAYYYDSEEAAAFYLDGDGVMTSGDYYSGREDGVLVRCVAR